MFGSKKEKGTIKKAKNPIKFDIETMESNLKNPYRKKEYNLSSENGKGEKESAKIQPSPPQEKEAPPREKQPDSPFLTDKITSVPSSTYDLSQSDSPKEKVLSLSPDNNPSSPKGPLVQFEKEPGQTPQNMPTSGVVSAPEKSQSQSEMSSSENIFHKHDPSPEDESTTIPPKKKMGRKGQIQKKGGVNKPLMAIAIIILIATLGAGAYYYFFVLNENEAVPFAPATDSNSNDLVASPDDSIESEEFDAEEFIVQDDLLLELKNYLDTIKNDPEKTALLSSGFLLKPIKNKEALTASQVLEGMHISVENLNLYTGEKAWLFLSNEFDDGSVIKVSLLLLMDKTAAKEDVHSSLLAKENTFPVSMKAMYVDEVPPTDPAPEAILFSMSTVNPLIRFFNYQKNDHSRSIDWGLTAHKEGNYLILTTSRKSTSKLFNFLDT